MRVVRFTLLGLLVLVFLLAGTLTWLVGTPSGARAAADLAQRFVPELELEVTGGSLWSGLELSFARWQDGELRVETGRVVTGWDMGCLTRRAFCLQAQVHDLEAFIPEGDPGDAPDPEEGAPDTPMERLDLPLAIQVERLELRGARVQVAEHDIALDFLNLEGDLSGDVLNLERTETRGLRVRLPEPADEEDAADAGEAAPLADFQYQPPELPDLQLPLDVHLQTLRMRDSALWLPGEDQPMPLPDVDLTASLEGQSLGLARLDLSHPYGELRSRGQLALGGDWDVALDLDVVAGEALADSLPLVLPGVPEFSLRMEGALKQELQLALEAVTGHQALALDARLAPLDEQLPFELALRWPHLGWPLDDPGGYRSRDGALNLTGDLSGWQATLRSEVAGPELPAGLLRLDAHGDLTWARLEALTLEALEGTAELSGAVDWSGVLQWDIDLALRDLNPGSFWEGAPEQVSGRVESQGQLTEAGPDLRLRIPGIEALVQDYTLALDGAAGMDPAGHLHFDDINLRVDGQAGLTVAGALTDRWDLDGEISLPDLSALGVPDLAGALAGRFQLRGERDRPDLEAELSGDTLSGPGGVALGALELTARLPALGQEDSRLALRLSDLSAGPEHLNDVALEITGREAAHRLDLLADGRGGLELDLALTGAFDRETGDWEGELAHALAMARRYGHRLNLEQPLDLAWDAEAGRLRLAPHCWTVNEQGRLCIDDPAALGADGELAFSLSDYDLQAGLRPWLPEDLALVAGLDAEGQVAWGDALTAQLALSSEDGLLRLRLDEEDEEEDFEELRYDALTAQLDYRETEATLAVDFTTPELGGARLRVTTDPRPEARGLDGELVLEDLDLSMARPFAPDLSRLEGVIAARAEIGGHWEDPQVTGQVTLADGLVDGPDLPVTLSDLRLDVDVAGSRADYRGEFRAGDGRGQLHGRVLWGGAEWRVMANLDGDALEVFLPPGLDLAVSPALRAVVRPNHVLLRGRVDVPRGMIDIQDLPEQAVGLSRDVVVVRRTEEMPVTDEQALEGWDLDVDIELRLGADELALSAFGLTGRLEGNMRVRLRDDVPEGVGEIRIVDGRYRAYGQNLRIRRGTLLFAGPVDQPELDIEAVRNVSRYDVVAGIRVEGRADDPRARLFAEPAMPDDEALSYLIRGRPLSAEGDGAEAMMASAALGLGVSGASGIIGGVGEALGVEDVEVEAVGEGDETQVVVGGYLNPRLYISYGVGVFSPDNTLTLRYQLARQLFLEAVSGVENALDLMYRFEFGGRGGEAAPPEPDTDNGE